MPGKIQVGYLVSYDYELLKNSIPAIYAESDTIYLAIDKNRKTWKGDTIEINPDFFTWIEAFDVNNKIVIYEEEFYVSTFSTMECEVRERKMLAEKMGIGNWLIQLDADEYFLDFKSFVAFLRSKNHFLDNCEKNKIQIAAFLINLYKKVDGGFLYVNQATKVLVATNYPNYKKGRNTRSRVIYIDSLILHECLSRTKEELITKFSNWGHNTDIDLDAFIKKWETVNSKNYKTMSDFFYLDPKGWKSLEFVKGDSLKQIFEGFQKIKNFKRTNFFIWNKNFGQWFKFLFK